MFGDVSGVDAGASSEIFVLPDVVESCSLTEAGLGEVKSYIA